MHTDILIRYAHFISIFLVVAAVVGQTVALRPRMTRGEVDRLQRLDVLYAIGAVLVVGSGLLQWFATVKPSEMYSKNPLFHIKFTLFLVIGLLSIYPSLFLGRQRKGDANETVDVSPLVRWSVRAELVLLLLMPLLATLVAKGIGLRMS